jgi:hypothetical protein
VVLPGSIDNGSGGKVDNVMNAAMPGYGATSFEARHTAERFVHGAWFEEMSPL